MGKRLKKWKKEKGITLIALVITIIVLLILAAVSIATLTGENGILTKAQKAKEETKITTEEEQKQLTIAEASMNFENEEYIDKNKDKAIIPAGFAVSQVEGENVIDDGLVVIDSNGNEFVWIPCAKEDVETKYENANKLSNDWPSVSYTSDLEGADTDKDPRLKGKTGWKNPETQIQDGKNSITNYGGFYIARYEAGVPSNADFYVPSKENVSNDTYSFNKNVYENLKPVSKKGNQVWNFISQDYAKKVSENMYENNSSISSYLVDSNSWNYICNYIFKDKVGKKLEDTIDWGDYSNTNKEKYLGLTGLYAIHTFKGGSWTKYSPTYNYGEINAENLNDEADGSKKYVELSTGFSDEFKAYNIYDMAGNHWEFTTEMTKGVGADNINTYCVVRGGCFYSNGSSNSTLVRSEGHVNINKYFVDYGFRVVLYLK